LLGPEQRRRMLADWNATANELPQATLADLAAEQLARTPDAVALVEAIRAPEARAVAGHARSLTYREFDAAANRLARTLIRAGVGPETTVVLAMRRSIELVLAMHAVVRAGGAYVPVDPDHPVERIAYIVETAAPACVLTTSADGVPIATELPVIDLDSVLAQPLSQRTRSRTAPIRDEERL